MPFPITDQADLYYRNETPRHASQNSGNRVYPSEGRFAAQPYITRDIGQRWGFNVGFDDGLVRGGIVTLVDRAANDVVRLTKFSLDLPKGPLFLAKQVGLQLMNPRFQLSPLSLPERPGVPSYSNIPPPPSPYTVLTNDGEIGPPPMITNNAPSTLRLGFSDTQVYNPLSTIIQAGLTPLGLHFQRHSLPYVFPKYEEFAKEDPLTSYKEILGTEFKSYNKIDLKPKSFTISEGNNNTTPNPTNTSNLRIETRQGPLNDPKSSNLVNLYVNHILYDYEQNSPLIEYPTGPGSMLGIGYTTIKRYDNTRKDVIQYVKNMTYKEISVGEFAKRPTFDNIGGINFYSSDDEKNKTGNIKSRITLENSVRFSAQSGLFNDVTSSKNIELNSFGKQSPILNIASSSLGSNFEQEEIEKTGDIESRIILKSNTFNAVNARFGTNAFTYDQLTSYTADTPKPGFKSTNNQTYRDFRQSTTPGLAGKVGFDDYEKMNIHNRVKVMDTGLSGSKFDEINTQDIGGSIPRDLVKFAFEAIDNQGSGATEVITFRAYIKDFGDDYSAKWNSVDYMGRGEKFYTYEGFERKIKVSFTIFAHSVKEMKPLYRKLLYLFSQTAPDYSSAGYMRGPFVKLTIGNWFYRLPGFIGSISTTVDGKDTPWEITLNSPENGSDTGMLELPKLLEISLDFTPIHDFTPQKGKPSSLTKFLNLKGWFGSGGGAASGNAATGSANTGGDTTGGTTIVKSTDDNGVTINTNTVPTK